MTNEAVESLGEQGERAADPFAKCRDEGGHGWVYRHGPGIPGGVHLRECMICPAVEIDVDEVLQAAEKSAAMSALGVAQGLMIDNEEYSAADLVGQVMQEVDAS